MAETNEFQEFIKSLMPQRPQTPGADLSSLFGAFSQGKKADRVTEGGFRQRADEFNVSSGMDFNNQMLVAQTNRNQNEADALRKLAQATYLAQGGSQFKLPAQLDLGGRKYAMTDFGFGPKPASEEQKTAANNLMPMLLQRLQSGGSYVPERPEKVDVSDYATPGLQEDIGSYGAVGLGALEQFNRGKDLLAKLGIGTGAATAAQAAGSLIPGSSAAISATNAAMQPPAILAANGTAGAATTGVSKILGKAAPIAGAVTGGVGLLKDRGVAGNVMNGVTAGASIGSMVPGLGTAVGAGIGALIGGLRSLGGGPSKEEKAARSSAGQLISQLTSAATPQQRAEAAQAGWAKPEEALANIVLRDKALSKGLPESAASTAMQGLFSATKKNPAAVNSAGQVISQIMGVPNNSPALNRQGW